MNPAPNTLHGHCFCEKVEFEIAGDTLKLVQCHCSLCRRQSGAASNAAALVPLDRFRWIRGEDSISSWTHESGFRSDFCSVCGSPVPNPLKNLPYVWVPAGLLEDKGHLEIVAHLCVASRASWDTAALQGVCYDEMPADFREFLEVLQVQRGQ